VEGLLRVLCTYPGSNPPKTILTPSRRAAKSQLGATLISMGNESLALSCQHGVRLRFYQWVASQAQELLPPPYYLPTTYGNFTYLIRLTAFISISQHRYLLRYIISFLSHVSFRFLFCIVSSFAFALASATPGEGITSVIHSPLGSNLGGFIAHSM
jgi:hypothetical protein